MPAAARRTTPRAARCSSRWRAEAKRRLSKRKRERRRPIDDS
jgi:hypothetical protein